MQAQEIIIEQGSPEWLSVRKEKIGSSDAASIMGVSKWSTPYMTWCEKLDLVPSKEENSAMRRGKELEPQARNLFISTTGINVEPKVFIKDFQIASFDGVSECNKIAVEIKCPGIIDHECALQRKIPEYYYPQLQHQMIVLDLKEMYYFSYLNNENAEIILVKRDDDYCEKLLDKEKQFWDNLQTLEPPSLLEKDYEERKDALWFEKSKEWHRINCQLKQLEIEEDKLRREIIEMAQGKNCKGAGIKASFHIRKGQVNYASIPGLSKVDLEKYRKPKTIVWKLGEI